jgi:hypothetical protein
MAYNFIIMSNLNDIINLAKTDGGKFFVIDESGEPKLVIMSIEDYQKLLLGKLQRQILDVEKINKEILEAQLTDEPAVPTPATKGPTVSSKEKISNNDLRAEVIDPSFDFEGPKVEIDDL